MHRPTVFLSGLAALVATPASAEWLARSLRRVPGPEPFVTWLNSLGLKHNALLPRFLAL
jgi:hypothetical protein